MVLAEDNLPALASKADVIMATKRAPSLMKNSPSRSSDKTNLCWYHAKFGETVSPVDHRVLSQPDNARLRETGRPAPSGARHWPKSKPFVVCVESHSWPQVPS